MFLPLSTVEKAGIGFLKQKDGNFEGELKNFFQEISGLDFGEGVKFVPTKLLLRFQREVVRFGHRKPQLALVFADLLVDPQQVLMVIVAAALRAIGYEIEELRCADMAKRGRGERGPASFQKKITEAEFYVEFDEDMLAMGKQKSKLASWLGLQLRTKFSYHIPTNEFDKQDWEKLWSDAKVQWKILDDGPKDVFIRKAKKNITDRRSKLFRKYVNKNKTPFEKYDYLDSSMWPEFVESKTTKEFLEKSAKAKASALNNKDFHRTGRTGYRGLKDNFDDRWQRLMASDSSVKKLQDKRTQLHVAARAKLNKKTGLYEVNDIHEQIDNLSRTESEMKANGTYFQGQDDPLTRCVGPERGGRSRTVSYVIGSTKVHGGLYKCGRQQNQNGVPTTQTISDEMGNANQDRQMVDEIISFFSLASGGSYIEYLDIQRTKDCERRGTPQIN
ncbi:hypothetical protein L1987_71570 [Smallanthus sonchifolius]|uniref:Uncharacterized protein n=1 Tax=Smallanthus sonchifolius TaxID=185202 RepID=A0ACB9ASS9_9ASTR|nr:hypothetical protein L1987_71570 [Smallanthus sonchifolius]